MKTIELVDFEKFSTRAVLRQIIEGVSPNSGGLSVSDMRRRIKLLDKVEAADKKLELEDADHNYLVQLLQGFPFGVVHPDLVAIADAIEG